MKEGTYAKTVAKIQVRGIFRIRDIRRNVLPKLIEIPGRDLYGDAIVVLTWMSSNMIWRTETDRNICYRVLLQKREFILRETHKH